MTGETSMTSGRERLLERDPYLEALENSFSKVLDGRGVIVMISGEAGIGKTSLVENFIRLTAGNARMLWGYCDALFTPRPLGPLYDIASQQNNGLLNLLNTQAHRPVIFGRFIQDLQEKDQPTVVIIEDAHWADESTLDLIKFLGRRINSIHALFIITYRDDEIQSSHPLRLVLGDIPPKNMVRIKLPPLTEATVNRLATSHGVKNLFEITRGNPFLIKELLNNQDEQIPVTVKDAILTRILRLSDPARELVELVSIIPTRAEKWLIEEIFPLDPVITDECFNSGILKFENDNLSFKHELSRLAVEESINDLKKQSLNEKALRVLLKQGKIDRFLARIIHHAARAHNRDVIIQYAAEAARQASLLGAHSQAADHYQNALGLVDDLSYGKRLEFYEGRSYECYLTGQIAESIKACEAIIEILKKHPNPLLEGENYRRMSRALWYAGYDFKSEKCLYKAVEILEKLPPGRQLAMTYSNLSQLYYCRGILELTVNWGEKAINLAKKLHEPEIEVHSLNNIGACKMMAGDDNGEPLLKKSLELSLQNDFHEHAARAFDNLGVVYTWRWNLSKADEYFSSGIEYSSEKDIDTLGLCMEGYNTKTKLYRGDWDDAVEMAGSVLKRKNVPLINKIIPLSVVGIIRARRGDPGALSALDELNALGTNIGEVVEMIVPIKTARAEAFWLKGKLDNIIEEVVTAYGNLKDRTNPWAIGELAFWLWRGIRLPKIPDNIAEPYLLQMKGEWRKAAGIWEDLQCPYEQAMALSDGDEAAMKKALEILDQLGASAAVELTKQKMRAMGLRSIPRGPINTTRKNPAGLTTRQFEILKLLGDGMSNSDIGHKLFISPKTVDHHISAIFEKLGVHSRLEAAAYAHANTLFGEK